VVGFIGWRFHMGKERIVLYAKTNQMEKFKYDRTHVQFTRKSSDDINDRIHLAEQQNFLWRINTIESELEGVIVLQVLSASRHGIGSCSYWHAKTRTTLPQMVRVFLALRYLISPMDQLWNTNRWKHSIFGVDFPRPEVFRSCGHTCYITNLQ
jgi:hypothetical protein